MQDEILTSAEAGGRCLVPVLFFLVAAPGKYGVTDGSKASTPSKEHRGQRQHRVGQKYINVS